MLSVNTLLALFFVGVLAWFWSDSLRARERALRVCSGACRQVDVQLLDQTVAVSRLSLGRDPAGRVRVRRFYTFEFSTNGAQRFRGYAVLLGRIVEYVHMDHPDGPVIQGPGTGAGQRYY